MSPNHDRRAARRLYLWFCAPLGVVILLLVAAEGFRWQTNRRLEQFVESFNGTVYFTPRLPEVVDSPLFEMWDGAPYLGDANKLVLRRQIATDDLIAQLPALNALQELQLWETSVTDDGLRAFADLHDLTYCVISGTPISSGIQHLVQSQRLETLILGSTAVDDEAMRHVAKFRELQFLGLARNPVGDRGIEEIAGLSKLTHLGLYNTKITDRSLQTICRLPNLDHLNVARTAISDAGVPALLSCRQLRVLDISGNNITARGISELSRAAGLEELTVSYPQVNEEALFSLARSASLTRLVILDCEGDYALNRLPDKLREAFGQTIVVCLLASFVR